MLQGLQHFQPYQHSGHTFTKSDREECILGSLRGYFNMEFKPVRLLVLSHPFLSTSAHALTKLSSHCRMF